MLDAVFHLLALAMASNRPERIEIALLLGFEEVGSVHAGDSILVRGFSGRRRLLGRRLGVFDFDLVLVEGFGNHVAQCLQMHVVDVSVWWQPRQNLSHSPPGVCTREMFRLVLQSPPSQ